MKINYRVSKMENILKGLKLRNTFWGHKILVISSIVIANSKHINQLPFIYVFKVQSNDFGTKIYLSLNLNYFLHKLDNETNPSGM